jgi:hypothetical protein
MISPFNFPECDFWTATNTIRRQQRQGGTAW